MVGRRRASSLAGGFADGRVHWWAGVLVDDSRRAVRRSAGSLVDKFIGEWGSLVGAVVVGASGGESS